MKRLVMLLLVTMLLSTTSMALADLPYWVQLKLEYVQVGEGENAYWNLGSVYGPYYSGTNTWTTGGTINWTSPDSELVRQAQEEAKKNAVTHSELKKTELNCIPTGMVAAITNSHKEGIRWGANNGKMSFYDTPYFTYFYGSEFLDVEMRGSYNHAIYTPETLDLIGYVIAHTNGIIISADEFYDAHGNLLLCSFRIDDQDYFATPELGWIKGNYLDYQSFIQHNYPETDYSRSIELFQPVTDGNILNKLNAVKNFGQTGTTTADDTQTDGQTTVNVTNVYVTNVTQVVSSGDGTTQANNQVPQDGSQFANTWQQISGKWYYYGSDGTVQKNGWIGEYYLTEDGSMAVNQWIDGKWYVGADGKWVPDAKPQEEETTATATNEETVSAEKGTWMQEGKKWWFQKDDGSYVANAWAWIDGDHDGYAECYYFDDSGYMAANRKIGTYRVNKSGAWTVKGVVQRMKVQ